MIGIIDYGAGNLLSVKKAFDYLGTESRIVSTVKEFDNADRIVLPGVGAFGTAAGRLKESGFYELIKEWLQSDRSFLGICLGMQLLFESSFESTGADGFGFFLGHCLRFNKGKVPQIGWNRIEIIKDSKLLEGIPDGSFFYFLHSYYAATKKEDFVVASTQYGINYPSVMQRGNIHAVQFHPEKSGESGLKLLKNWESICWQ